MVSHKLWTPKRVKTGRRTLISTDSRRRNQHSKLIQREEELWTGLLQQRRMLRKCSTRNPCLSDFEGIGRRQVDGALRMMRTT